MDTNRGRLLSYRTVLRSEAVKALKAIFPQNMEYEGHRLDKVTFDTRYPLEKNVYPHVEVVYEESKLEPSGIGDVSTFNTYDGDGATRYHHWLSEGTLKLIIQARNDYETDLISDGLIMALGVDNRLQEMLNENGYFNIFVDAKNIRPGISSGGGMQTYDSDDIKYMQTMNLPVKMQFIISERKTANSGIVIESVLINVTDESGHLDTHTVAN